MSVRGALWTDSWYRQVFLNMFCPHSMDIVTLQHRQGSISAHASLVNDLSIVHASLVIGLIIPPVMPVSGHIDQTYSNHV